jgi:protein-tyrosine-phosphatase/predicted ATP-grasp superfamily ATP-dependent carboligase
VGINRGEYLGKVLVLGFDNKAFLSVIRSLGRHNLQIHAGWCFNSSPALFSKYLVKVHDIPPYFPSDDSWKDALTSVLQRERFDLVVPCHDQNIHPLQKHRAELEKFSPIYLLDDDVFEVVFNKFKTIELAEMLDVQIPRWIRVSKLEEAGTILSRFQLPVVIKPHASFTLDDLTHRHIVLKAYNPEELYSSLEVLLRQGDVQIQENFIGTGVAIGVLADCGDLLLAFQYIRIHEPMVGGQGESSYRKSVSLDPELLDATKKMLKALSYTGVGMFEFKMNFETGQWVFLEINGRFWGSLPLAISAGADFPYYLYQLLLEGKRDFPKGYKTDIYCRNLYRDSKWMWENFKADKTDPTLASLPLDQVAREIVNILALRERSDTLVMDDPKPGLMELLRLIITVVRKAVRRAELFLLSFRPTRKIVTYRARRALKKARSILFLCKGNIYRSPFAKYYAQSVLPESIEVMSCGFFPEHGRTCPEDAVLVAGEMGVKLMQHRSSAITEEIVRQAQVIFTFDEENLRTLLARYPFAKGKVYRLGLLAEQGPAIVDDPWGGNLQDIRVTFKTIKRALDSSIG